MSINLATFEGRIKILTYVLAASAVTSCIIRNDYNVVFAFLILGIINKYYNDGQQYYSKIIFQLLAALILIDVIWLIITLPYWNSEPTQHKLYWESLSFVHGLAIFLCFIQMGIKGLMLFLVFSNHKKQYNETGELFTIHYDVAPKH